MGNYQGPACLECRRPIEDGDFVAVTNRGALHNFPEELFGPLMDNGTCTVRYQGQAYSGNIGSSQISFKLGIFYQGKVFPYAAISMLPEDPDGTIKTVGEDNELTAETRGVRVVHSHLSKLLELDSGVDITTLVRE